MLWLALRIFGGNVPVALLSYQSFYCLFYGQIVGLLAGALALLWWSLVAKRVWLAGVMLALACTKVQLGVPMGLTLLLLANVTWLGRLKALLVAGLVALVSILLYPSFLVDVYYAALATPPNNLGSVSLWRYVGAAALSLPVGWLGLLGNVGYAMVFIGWRALPLLVIVPLVAYGWVFASHIRQRHTIAEKSAKL
jgi:hypothetical protein